MLEPLNISDGDEAFLQKVANVVGVRPCACLTCRSCSARCSMYEYMDYGPHGIIRLVLMGLKKEALTSNTIWRCLGCRNCWEVCPMGIDSSSVMTFLQTESLADNMWSDISC